MNHLSEILRDLADTDRTLQELGELAEWGSPDPASRTNLTALAKRRRDLEKTLDSALSASQLDLIQLRVEREDERPPPAATIARAVILLQAIVTSVFDAVRGDTPASDPPATDGESVASMTFATDPRQTDAVSLSIPNDRLLAIRSDLDLALEQMFALFELRSIGDLKAFGKRTGLGPIAKLHEWTTMSAADALRTSISWRKSRDQTRLTTVSPSQAAALQGMIASAYDSETAEFDTEGRLVGIDDARGTFRFEAFDGAQIEGRLAEEFPRGRAWVMNTALAASLTRTSRTDYASGARKEEWVLRNLTSLTGPS